MAGNRTLKLSILADVDNLKKGLDQGQTEVGGFGGKLDGFAAKAGVAFAAAGAAAVAYAGKLAIDGVKAAIEDEAAQVRLANSLKNVTGATDDQIKSAEAWILKTSLASGVADDQLRPALERLTRSTKDIKEAQELTNLALDIAKAKNIDVETAANALAKANDGQTGALKKLGITLGDNATNLQEYNKVQKAIEKAQLDANFALKEYGSASKEYQSASEKVAELTGKANDIAKQGIDVFGELGKEFSGASAEAANTFQGKMDRVKIALDEAKESVGGLILDALAPLLDVFVNKLIPAFSDGQEFMSKYLLPIFTEIWNFIKNLFTPIIQAVTDNWVNLTSQIKTNHDNLKPLLTLMKELFKFAAENLAPFIGNVLAGALSKLRDFIDFIKDNPLTKGIGSLFGNSEAPNVPAKTSGSNFSNASFGSTNITINGAIDPVSTARQIYDVLNSQATESGTFNAFGMSYAL